MKNLLLLFTFLSLSLLTFGDSLSLDSAAQDSSVAILEEDTAATKADTAIAAGEKTFSPDKQYKVYKFDVKTEIGPAIWRQMQKAFDEAKDYEADLILLHMNTYGGMVIHADSMRTKILNSSTPVFVFIDNNAASAGALISIACDSIYMREGGNMGAATVVNQEGAKMPDKYQSYMRSTMRSTAEAKGRDPMIAQAMVDESIAIEGLIDSTKVLTFTASEAMENGFCEGMAENIEEVLSLSGIEDYEIKSYNPGTIEKIIGLLVNPAVSGILIMIIIGGIYFELQTPGLGFPIAAAFIAATLYFAPLYLEGLAENWEIVVFGLGVLLLAVEIFAIPGFGVAGISGLALMLTGLTLSLIGNVGFNFDMAGAGNIMKALFTVITALVVGTILAFLLGKRFLEGSLFNRITLAAELQGREETYTSPERVERSLIGKQGIAYTDLRPSGKIEMDDDIYDATALTGYIEKGSDVKLIKYESAQFFVTKVE